MGTLIWTDTFDTYTAGSPIPAPWTAVSNTPISNAVKHGGANSVAVGAGGNNSGAIRALGSNVGPQFYIDFWFNSTAAVTSGASIVFYDTGASDLGIEFMPNFNSATSGLVRTSFLANFFSFTVAPGTWQHAVLEVTRALAGSVKLTIDGTVVGTYSGDTRGTSNQTFVNAVNLHGSTIGAAPAAEFYVDDLSIYSGVNTPASTQGARVTVMA